MEKKTRCKDGFPLFEKLAPLLPKECRKKVLDTLNLLENVWRNDLCKAVITWLTKGKLKQYKKSRVMRRLFEKIVKTLPSSLKGRGLAADENSNR